MESATQSIAFMLVILAIILGLSEQLRVYGMIAYGIALLMVILSK